MAQLSAKIQRGLKHIPDHLRWDVAQFGIDLLGIFDPTPISDGANLLISLCRGDFLRELTSDANRQTGAPSRRGCGDVRHADCLPTRGGRKPSQRECQHQRAGRGPRRDERQDLEDGWEDANARSSTMLGIFTPPAIAQ